MLSYDVLSTMIATKLYGRFADLSPVYNFIWQSNPLYVLVWLVFLIPSLIFAFWGVLTLIESERQLDRILVISFDFWAVYILIFELIAIPHNTLVLFGQWGIVLSSKMFLIQKIASALIAGVIVIVVDWKSVLRRAKG
jgi:hypothetical protein